MFVYIKVTTEIYNVPHTPSPHPRPPVQISIISYALRRPYLLMTNEII